MKTDLTLHLQRFNQQLEKVSLRQRQGKLYIRGKAENPFPRKPGE